MSKVQVRVRLATEGDKAAWLPLWQGYQVFYHADLGVEQAQVNWQRFMDEAEPMWALVATVDQRIVGFTHLIEHRSCWTIQNYGYLQDLYVDESMRGHGVGRALIEAAYQWGKAKNWSRVYWLTEETNHTAQQLYDRIAKKTGFIQYKHVV
ncbi:MAG: GNAT family N-acetyltransferase [Neisseriaceae bacterium]|nr:GNAT family N-acetyltransferase [Neisseriaceae bacterium]MBP6863354.1 GNAT family N-acetyltransferase [Neisseriaceae bacterium]